MDLAHGFLAHITNAEWAEKVRSYLEMSAKEQGDDEFAAVYGLV
jgi:hypothetical protein